MKTLTINDEDYDKAKKLLVEHSVQNESKVDETIPLLRKNNDKTGKTPQFLGVFGRMTNVLWNQSERKQSRIIG